MRKLYNILALVLFLSASAFMVSDSAADEVQDCASQAGENALYLKDFSVKLAASLPNQKPRCFARLLC